MRSFSGWFMWGFLLFGERFPEPFQNVLLTGCLYSKMNSRRGSAFSSNSSIIAILILIQEIAIISYPDRSFITRYLYCRTYLTCNMFLSMVYCWSLSYTRSPNLVSFPCFIKPILSSSEINPFPFTISFLAAILFRASTALGLFLTHL